MWFSLVGRDDNIICEPSATILSFLLLAPGGGGGEGTSPNKKGAQGGDGGEKGEEGAGGAGEGGGSKPQLRVYIPGQKEFVPRTVSEPAECIREMIPWVLPLLTIQRTGSALWL